MRTPLHRKLLGRGASGVAAIGGEGRNVPFNPRPKTAQAPMRLAEPGVDDSRRKELAGLKSGVRPPHSKSSDEKAIAIN